MQNVVLGTLLGVLLFKFSAYWAGVEGWVRTQLSYIVEHTVLRVKVSSLLKSMRLPQGGYSKCEVHSTYKAKRSRLGLVPAERPPRRTSWMPLYTFPFEWIALFEEKLQDVISNEG